MVTQPAGGTNRYFLKIEGGFVRVVIHRWDADGNPYPDLLNSGLIEVSAEEFAQAALDSAVVDVDGVRTYTPPPPPPRRISIGEFVDLFTLDQQTRFYMARQTDVEVALMWDRLQLEPQLIQNNPRIVASLQILVGKNLLSQEEATRIASFQPPA